MCKSWLRFTTNQPRSCFKLHIFFWRVTANINALPFFRSYSHQILGNNVFRLPNRTSKKDVKKHPLVVFPLHLRSIRVDPQHCSATSSLEHMCSQWKARNKENRWKNLCSTLLPGHAAASFVILPNMDSSFRVLCVRGFSSLKRRSNTIWANPCLGWVFDVGHFWDCDIKQKYFWIQGFIHACLFSNHQDTIWVAICNSKSVVEGSHETAWSMNPNKRAHPP